MEHSALKPRELTALLTAAIPAKLPILIQGAPGIGKSDLVYAACESTGHDLIVSHPVTSDPTDYKGFPSPQGDHAAWLPYGDLLQILDGRCKRPTVFFADDLGQAPASVQAAMMQLILARRVNEHRVSDHVVFVAATNRREDRAAVSGLLEPLKSRFASIVTLEPSLDDWCTWANRAGMPPELVSFVRFRPHMLSAFAPTPDLTNSPSPRTIANVGRLMGLGLPQGLELPAYTGAAGAGFASELLAYLDIYRSLPDIDRLLADPQMAILPDFDAKPAVGYALCGALAFRASLQTFKAISALSYRIPAEYAALLMADCLQRTTVKGEGPSPLAKTKEWADWVRNNPEMAQALAS